MADDTKTGADAPTVKPIADSVVLPLKDIPAIHRQDIITDEEEKALQQFDNILQGKLENDEELMALIEAQTLDKEERKLQRVRFLRARSLKPSVAVDLFIGYLHWRKEYGVDALAKEPRPYDFQYNYLVSLCYHGCDRYGRPMYVEKTGHIHAATFARVIPAEIVARTHVWFLEQQIERMRESSKKVGYRVTQLVNVMDMEGISIAFAKLIHLFGAVSKIDQDYYVERLGAMYMVRCPWIFTTIWKLCRPFLHQKTLDKIHILGYDYTELVNELGAENLPKEYGGTCECKAGGCMPRRYSKEELDKVQLGVSEDEERDFEAVQHNVGRGADHTLDVHVKASKEAPVTVDWWFKTLKRDIGFSVHFVPTGSDEKEVVEEPQRVQSHKQAVHATHTTEVGGCYTFTWDNTFSRWNGKTVRYSVEVHTAGDDDMVDPVSVLEAQAKELSLEAKSPTS